MRTLDPTTTQLSESDLRDERERRTRERLAKFETDDSLRLLACLINRRRRSKELRRAEWDRLNVPDRFE